MATPSGKLQFVSIAYLKADNDTPKKAMPPPASPSTVGQSGDDTITYSNSASKTRMFATLYDSDDDAINSKHARKPSQTDCMIDTANSDLNVKPAATSRKTKNRSTELDLLGEQEILPPKRNRSVDGKTSKNGKRTRKSVERG